jgi:hypothetical protein
MTPLFKSGSEIMEQALDLARRRDYPRARQKFEDAAAKLSKEGSVLYVDLARAYAELMLYPSRGADPSYLAGLANYLRASLGTTELRPGPRGISAAELAVQLDLAASEWQALAQVQSGTGDRVAVAQALQNVANGYRQLGPQVLFLPELFNQRAIPADSKFPVLMATSFETLGASLQNSDPLAAAEHFQTAQQYWIQAGDQARSEASARQVESLAFQARCWFCGREGVGHGVQFVSLPIDQDVTGLKGGDSSPLPAVDGSGRRLFACKGCSSALRLLADAIAAQRAYEVELRLNARIQALEQELQSVRASAFQR